MHSVARFGRVRRGAGRLGSSRLVRHGRGPSKLPERRPPSPPSPAPFMRETVQKISSVLRDFPWDSARGELRRLPVRWDSFTVNRVLKTHPPMEKAWLFFNWAAALPGFKHDQFTYTTMLDIFGEAGRVASMCQVLRDMEEKGLTIDAATYTSVMHWLAKGGVLEGAVAAWEEMRRRRGCRPTAVSYTAFMKILFDHGRPQQAAEVYREMMQVGLKPNCHTYTVMMEYLAGSGSFKEALEIMNEMQEAGIKPDKAACNILVHKCSKAGKTSAVTQVLQYMKENSIVLRRPVYIETLEAFRSSGESDHLLREVNPHLALEGLEEELLESETACNDPLYLMDRSIMLIFLGRRNLVALEHLLAEMVNKGVWVDSELLSAIVLANCENSRPSGALLAFDYSSEVGLKLERSAYLSLVGLLIRAKSFTMVTKIVEQMIHVGFGFGTYLLSLLIYKLGCAGLPDSAVKIFTALPADQGTSTYTALMHALFRAGEVQMGMELYSKMRMEGISSSFGTYEVLISGLEKAGRIHDANVYRKEKKSLQWCASTTSKTSTEEMFCDRFFGPFMT